MRKLSMNELNRKTAIEYEKSGKMPVIVVLENVRSAYNVGSVFRTADAFLLYGIYICGYTAHPPHKEIKKTALGADETVHWIHFKTAREAIDKLRKESYKIFSIEQAENSIALNRFNLLNGADQKLAVVFGNEVTGVEQATIELSDGCIEIPQLGMKHSLNISVAAGIVLWELVRTRMALLP
ncbi:MAG: RNA methyltransferase [Chitinophagaceae bacterium]